MQIHLAPMEGVIDLHMRKLLTAIGGFDFCVTEFIRVSDQLLPARVFHRLCPELALGCRTESGVPVVVQLLGGDPTPMAENAARAAELGAPIVDVNFGCPSKTVCRHDGGANLLKDPERVFAVVEAVRRAVPEPIPVTAKMRLGFHDKSQAVEIAQAIEAAGADRIAIHARTKAEGYKPPAHWEFIGKISAVVATPIVANGEIWTLEDYRRCVELSGVEDVMLGRGAIAMPDLANQIKRFQQSGAVDNKTWHWVASKVSEYYLMMQNDKPRYVAGRLKQWLGFLSSHYQDAEELFASVKRLKDPVDIHALVQRSYESS